MSFLIFSFDKNIIDSKFKYIMLTYICIHMDSLTDYKKLDKTENIDYMCAEFIEIGVIIKIIM